MRIGVNTLFMVPGEVGGTETYLREILSSLASDFDELDLLLFTNVENDDMFRALLRDYRKVSYCRLNLRARSKVSRVISEQTELPLKARAARIDLLWSPGYTAPLLASCPQVVTVHDMQYKSFPGDFSAVNRVTLDLLVRLGVRRCAAVMTDSEFARDDILRHTGVRAEKVHVVYGGVSGRFSEMLSGQALRGAIRNQLGSEVPYIFCVADSYPHKNLAVLVEAFRELEHEIPHKLVLLGNARLGEPAVAGAVRGLADPDRVVRIKRVPREDLVALYQAADLFVFPSLYEGFGLPVLEAMKAGLPVVAARRGAVPEVGGDCICYFDGSGKRDLVARMREMLGMDHATRRQWARKAQARAGRFTWADAAEKTVECFSRVAKR